MRVEFEPLIVNFRAMEVYFSPVERELFRSLGVFTRNLGIHFRLLGVNICLSRYILVPKFRWSRFLNLWELIFGS